jgi:hypothetical protein
MEDAWQMAGVTAESQMHVSQQLVGFHRLPIDSAQWITKSNCPCPVRTSYVLACPTVHLERRRHRQEEY